MRQAWYACKHCGNVIAMICDRGVPVCCCGEEMRKMTPGGTEGSEEKHGPVYTREGNTVHVTVGAAAHPMTEEHHIEWICLESEHGIQYAYLKPTEEPEASFALCEGDEVRAVYAFCNQHELWRK